MEMSVANVRHYTMACSQDLSKLEPFRKAGQNASDRNGLHDNADACTGPWGRPRRVTGPLNGASPCIKQGVPPFSFFLSPSRQFSPPQLDPAVLITIPSRSPLPPPLARCPSYPLPRSAHIHIPISPTASTALYPCNPFCPAILSLFSSSQHLSPSHPGHTRPPWESQLIAESDRLLPGPLTLQNHLGRNPPPNQLTIL